jgi:hypothetical protein
VTLRQTRTYATAPVSQATFDEVKKLLKEAGYDHAIIDQRGDEGEALDMHGIALVVKKLK